ncbi:MAG: DUF5309 family protein [Verrucomicrobiae bacterium]
MPATTEITQVGKREDLADIISVVDAKKCILSTLIAKGKKPTNTKFAWQADKYADPVTTGVVDGTDVSVYENAAESRAKLENHVQLFRREPMVTVMSEEVSQVAGISDADAQGVAGGTEFARAKAKKTVELKRDIETALLSDNLAQEDNGTLPYKTRGLGNFLLATAQAYLPVPADFRTPAASIFAAGYLTFDEDDLRTLLQSRWEKTGTPDANLIGILGSAVKNRITDFTRYTPTVSNYTNMRTYEPQNTRKVESVVDMYVGDYGTMELMLSNYLPDMCRGYILDPAFLELRTHTMPRIKPLPDLGGGPRCLIEAIVGLCVKNPTAHCKIAATVS